ncbi:MAG TPA: hypothetical protein VHH73_00790 [Verrucomicrobiae bacterium]|nr:hypothetical protein [Verrucomicrobiae bacterium]
MSDDPAPVLSWGPALRGAIVQQVLILGFALVGLSDSVLPQVCGQAAVAFWVVAVVIIARRRSGPTSTDLILLRSGYLPLCFVSYAISRLVWKLRGFAY